MKKAIPPRIVLGQNIDRFDDFGSVEIGADQAAPRADNTVPKEPTPVKTVTDVPDKAILTRMPAETHKALRLLAAREETSVQALMLEALALLGEKHGVDLSR